MSDRHIDRIARIPLSRVPQRVQPRRRRHNASVFAPKVDACPLTEAGCGGGFSQRVGTVCDAQCAEISIARLHECLVKCNGSMHSQALRLVVAHLVVPGTVLSEARIELPGPRVQHDMALSERFVCVFDFPLAMDMGRDNGLGFKMSGQPSRIGLLPRVGGEVLWFTVEACYMWHVMCARDEGDDFVLLGVRTKDATNRDGAGVPRNDRPLVDGEHRFDTYLHEWRLNTRTGAAAERDVDDVISEFPRVNDAFVCAGARHGYAALIDTQAATLRAHGLAKYDLQSYARQDLMFPDGCFGYEPCFAAPADSGAEDDGYVLGFVTHAEAGTSELWVTKADDFAAGAVARIMLPQRVPPGFHGRWIARTTYERAP